MPAEFDVYGVYVPRLLVLMVLSYRFPLLVPCPNCWKKRHATVEKCPRCGAAFPAAATNGTEVFA